MITTSRLQVTGVTGGPLRITGASLVNGAYELETAGGADYELQTERQVMLDNILFVPGIGWQEVPIPTGFDYTPPFRIEQFGARTFRTSYNKESFKVAASVDYYLSPSGNDANDGLSVGSPKKSISALIAALNTSPPAGANLFLAPGLYLGSDSINGSNFTFPCNVICQNGIAEMSARTIPTWSKTAGRTNIWQASVGSAIPSTIDLSDAVDEFGLQKRLRIFPGGDLDSVDATPGSVAIITSTMYIHTFDSRQPDSDVLLYGTSLNGLTQTSSVDLYFENIEWKGWNISASVNAISAAATACFQNCKFLYARNSNNLYSNMNASGLAITNDCIAGYAWNDGFNFDRGNVIHINGLGAWNGYSPSGTSENGSTTHNTVRSIRINCRDLYNKDRNVHDITSTRNWLLGCKTGFAQNGSTNKYANANFVFGRESQTDATLAWLDGCESLGGSASDLGVYGNAIVRLRNNIGLTITDGDGTIENY
jgi:hypothetical protein